MIEVILWFAAGLAVGYITGVFVGVLTAGFMKGAGHD